MAEPLDCLCGSIAGNSFIANVNLLASQFDTLRSVLEVPNQVNSVKSAVLAIESTINGIYADMKELKVDVESTKSSTETIRLKTEEIQKKGEDVYRDVLTILDKCKEVFKKIHCDITGFEAEMVIANGVQNQEQVFRCPEDVCPGYVMTLRDFCYPAGRKTLMISVDGMEIYRWLHFEEVGPKDQLSSTVKFNINIRKDSLLRFYNISSSMAETAYINAQTLNREIVEVSRRIQRDVTTVCKTSEKVADNARLVEGLKRQIKDYVDKYMCRSNGVMVFSDRCMIPDMDCLFMYNELLPQSVNPFRLDLCAAPVFSQPICERVEQKLIEQHCVRR